MLCYRQHRISPRSHNIWSELPGQQRPLWLPLHTSFIPVPSETLPSQGPVHIWHPATEVGGSLGQGVPCQAHAATGCWIQMWVPFNEYTSIIYRHTSERITVLLNHNSLYIYFNQSKFKCIVILLWGCHRSVAPYLAPFYIHIFYMFPFPFLVGQPCFTSLYLFARVILGLIYVFQIILAHWSVWGFVSQCMGR